MQRRLAAILAADVVGYSRLMEDDEAGTLQRMTALRTGVLEPLIAEHRGRLVKLMGDGLLVEFASVVDAVGCAVAWQAAVPKHEVEQGQDHRLSFRIGINLGDVIIEGEDIHGDGVNVAARLEALAEPGGIRVSGTVHEHIAGKLDHGFADDGEHTVKNIARPVHVWRWSGSMANPVRETTPLALPDKPSIAVLPFDNMSNDPEQEYFSDGITEDIITELSRYRELFVIARNSCFSFKGQSPKVQDVGRELGVGYVVEGSVRKAGNRVRVTAQLVEAQSGNHIWAERYDRNLEDVFAVQDELTQAIVSMLPGRLRGADLERANRKPTDSPTAYEYLLRARWRWERDLADFIPIVDLLERAVALDPGFARAHAFMAYIYAQSIFVEPLLIEELTRKARVSARAALKADDNDSFVHATAASYYTMSGEHQLALTHAQIAYDLNPNDIYAVHARGVAATYTGDLDEGLSWLMQSQRLDPSMPDHYNEELIECHYMRREYAEAIEVFHKWRNRPAYMYTVLAVCHAQLGQTKEAQAALETHRSLVPPERYDDPEGVEAHMRMMRRLEDREHWIEGYRKAGIEV